ncbi:MAG TPA: SOS response-associated peptidase family protein, partial [Polyangiaceae bacterium]|nr:SOS response-associated peptidase family protein [Polyangiaceae bacterium]
HFGRRLFAFAGLYSSTVTPDGEAIDSFAIITTEPTPVAAKFHDRMPLVLAPELYGRWLGASDDPGLVLDQARSLAAGMPLEVYASDPIANNGRYEGPRAIEAAPRPSLAVASPRAAVQGELFGSSERKARGG